MEPRSVAVLGRVVDAEEYYHLSQNLESYRGFLRQVRQLLPQPARQDHVLTKCVESHEYDDALGLLAVADSLGEGDSLSAEVWQLIGRHSCAGKLQKMLTFLRLIPREAASVRERLEFLVGTKFKRLACAPGTED